MSPVLTQAWEGEIGEGDVIDFQDEVGHVHNGHVVTSVQSLREDTGIRVVEFTIGRGMTGTVTCGHITRVQKAEKPVA